MTTRHPDGGSEVLNRELGVAHVFLNNPDSFLYQFFVNGTDSDLAGGNIDALCEVAMAVLCPFYNLLDPQFQDVQVEWLRDVVVGSVFQSGDDVCFR